MKNKEKYKDKILDIALQHDVVAVDKNDNSVEPCYDETSLQCNRCLFYDDKDEPYSCDEKFIKWLEEEANENEHKFLEELRLDEAGFLRIVEKGYIARHTTDNILDNILVYYVGKPYWSSSDRKWYSFCTKVILKTDSFKFIKAGECWAYNTDTNATNKDVIYNITKDLRKDIV